MPMRLIDECEVYYEEMGSGIPVVLTPGGRSEGERFRSLAGLLSGQYRVILWDRRNTGRSQVHFEKERSEQELWADDLAVLLKEIGAAPAYVGGASAGCRVSLLAAIRHPDVVKGLLLWQVTGGEVAAQQLGSSYHDPYIEAATKGGMEEVARTPFWAERIAMNPSNRARLLAQDPMEFIDVMRRWKAYFRGDLPAIGATEEDLRGIKAPAMVAPGMDEVHPRYVAERVARLIPNAIFIKPPWTPERYEALRQEGQNTLMEAIAPPLAMMITNFIREAEAAVVKAGG